MSDRTVRLLVYILERKEGSRVGDLRGRGPEVDRGLGEMPSARVKRCVAAESGRGTDKCERKHGDVESAGSPEQANSKEADEMKLGGAKGGKGRRDALAARDDVSGRE